MPAKSVAFARLRNVSNSILRRILDEDYGIFRNSKRREIEIK